METYPPSDTQTDQIKLPPHSVEAEQSVLGCLLLDGSALDKIADLVAEEHFYRQEHRLIYRQIVRLSEVDKPVDVVTVADALGAAGEANMVGGMPYLTSLSQNVPSSGNIRSYAEIVQERSVMRKLVEVCASISRGACNPDGHSAAQLLDEAASKMLEIAEVSLRGKHRFSPMTPLLSHVVERIDTLYRSNDHLDVTGTATGFNDLDRMTSGLQAGDLIVVAGHPEMGKTVFAINIAENVALNGKLPVAIFSMEISATRLAMRMLGSVGKIDQHDLCTGRLQDDDWRRITHALGRLNDAPIYIDESTALTALEIRARAGCLYRQHGGLGLIVVDSLQLMSSPGNKTTKDRATELAGISRSLKLLAKELHVPVIVLLPLDDIPEKRPAKRPVMSDLRESGAIARDADLILFIHRDDVCNRNSPHKDKAEIIIGKQRNGPIGMITLAFNPEYAHFDNFVSYY